MRIVNAEPQLVKDLVDEIEVSTSGEYTDYKVYAGRHPTLGRIIVIENADGTGGVVVETE